MIQALIFDLDGTLVQTEILKAISYAKAAVELGDEGFTENDVIEDSLTGVKAALAAGMQCIAVTTDITRKNIHASNLLEKQWIVDDPANLKTVAKRYISLFSQTP